MKTLKYAILFLAVMFAWGCAARDVSLPKTPQGPALTMEQFEEQWQLIIDRYVQPLPDTPEVRLACFQKLLARGLSSCLDDHHARYMTKEQLEETLAMMDGAFGGIGLVVSQKDIQVAITKILEDSPAQKSGQFQIGDVIIEVNGEDVSKSPAGAIVAKIRGDIDTSVTVRVQRDGAKRDPVTLTRKEFIVQSVNVRDIDDQITYVHIFDFNERTPDQFFFEVGRRLLVKLPDGRVALYPGLTKFVFDLRGNPGGLVDSVAMMSYFFSSDPNQIILTTHSRKGEVSLHVGNYMVNTSNIPPGVFHDIKLVILIDGKSASAAEIFAAFVHEATGAPRVGKKSYGKGSVQQIFRLSRGDALLFTIAEYFVGNQKTRIDKIGIQPEYEVDGTELVGNDAVPMQQGNPAHDPQLKKAIELLRASRD